MFRPRLRIAASVAACLALVASTCSMALAGNGGSVPGEVLVSFKSTPGSVSDLGILAGYQPKLKAYRMVLHANISADVALNRLRGRADVAYVERNNYLYGCSTPNDTYYLGNQYNLPKIQANAAWDIWQPRSQVVLAVIGSGVYSGHPDLKNVMYRDGLNAVIGYNSLTGATSAEDDNGHDTFNAGVAAAEINNATGVAGVAGWNPGVAGSKAFVKVMPIKSLSSALVGTDASVSQGIIWAADHGAKVINMSFAGPTFSATVDSAVQYAWGKGCVLVASAGNAGTTAVQYPAGYNNVISVGATDKADVLWASSQYGPWVKVLAPGVSVTSTYLGGYYNTTSGTSVSAAHVSGEAAAILAQNPTISNADLAKLIAAQVDPYIPYQGRTVAVGAGRINIAKALDAAGTGVPRITSLTIAPNVIPNGTTTTGSLSLGGPAPAGGATITLTSSNTAVATVPSSIVVPQGNASATFTITGKLIGSNSTATIVASDGIGSKSADVTVRGPVPVSVTFSPPSATGGLTVTGTVTLDSPAAAGGSAVTLADAGTITKSPSTVTVGAGLRTATFAAKTFPTTTRISAAVTATLNGISAVGSLMVNPSFAKLSAVSVNPASVVGGSNSTGTVTLDNMAPVGGAVVVLTSNNAAATVPLSVTVPAGVASTTFTVSTSSVPANVTATITATYGGLSKTALLTVQQGTAAASLSALSVSPVSVTGGASSTGTVTLSGAAPAGGVTIALSSDKAAASVPASVNIPAGSTSATFTVTTSAVSADVTANISGTYGGVTKSAALTVKAPPPALTGLTIAPTSIVGGNSVTGTVTLSVAAPAGGVAVALSSDNAAASVPASVTVSAGSTSATFTVSTSVVAANAVATIAGTYGGVSKSDVLTVLPPPPSAALTGLTIAPTSIVGGNSVTGTVTLSLAAPAGGVVVTLASDKAAASVPASVTVPAGSTTATFTISTSAVASDVLATITGTYNGVSKSDSLTVQAPPPSAALSGVTLSASSIAGGGSVTGTVTLTLAAPAGGITVNLSSDNAAASVPASVTVAAGSTTATFTVSTSAVASDVTANITGSYDGVSKSAALTVQAPPPPSDVALVSLTLSTTAVAGGTSATGKVTLSAAAPAGGTVVTLSSNNAAAGVPASVTVPAGATTATFTVTTSAVSSAVTATISAALGGVTKSATLQVRAPYISVLSVSPSTVKGGTSSTGKITLSGRAPSGGFTVNLISSNTAAATVQASVTVPAGSTSVTFPVNTSAVGASTVVEISGTPVGETRISKGTLTVTP